MTWKMLWDWVGERNSFAEGGQAVHSIARLPVQAARATTVEDRQVAVKCVSSKAVSVVPL